MSELVDIDDAFPPVPTWNELLEENRKLKKAIREHKCMYAFIASDGDWATRVGDGADLRAALGEGS